MVAGVPVSADYDVPVRGHSVHALLVAGRCERRCSSSGVRTSNTPAYTPDNAVYNDIAFAENNLLVGSVSFATRAARADMETTVTASRHELAPGSGYLNVFSGLQRSYKYAYGSMLRAEHQATWKAGPALRLTAGGAYERLFSVPQSADLVAPVTNRSQSGTLLGSNIQDERFQIQIRQCGRLPAGPMDDAANGPP